jgi:hypothetical protein
VKIYTNEFSDLATLMIDADFDRLAAKPMNVDLPVERTLQMVMQRAASNADQFYTKVCADYPKERGATGRRELVRVRNGYG